MGNLIGRGGGSGGGAATTLVKELISKHEVCVFSKTTCPYCVKAKDVLRADAAACAPPVPVHVVELDQRTDGAALQAALAQLSGRRTVPNVYIGGESIGGGDETVAARSSGVLKQMLVSARAKLDAVGPGHATAAAWSGANAEAKDAGGGGAMQTATFAAGCFWGVELHFQRVPGVLTTAVGYTQGRVEQPSYRAVCTGSTGHTEAVQLTFDPTAVSYQQLLDAFWARKGFNASQVNGQGNDHGTQYRSGIYYHDDAQRDLAEAAKATLEAKGRKIAVEVAPAAVFWPAEGYHQQYLEKGGQDARKGATSSIRCYG